MKIVVRIIASVLIFVLAAASVANIHTRAVQLHADSGWQTWGVSLGFAVTFALFAYLLIATKKPFFLAAAVFGAVLTSVLQVGMYLALKADWVTALFFGCGGPILEALLAMAEHYMDEPTQKKGAQSALLLRLGNAVVSRIERTQPAAQQAATLQLHSAMDELHSEPEEVQTKEVPPIALEALQMQENDMTIEDIAAKLKKSKRTISYYLKLAREAKKSTNGAH